MEWVEFLFALALFGVSHRVPAALGVKGALLRRLGQSGYMTVFSLVSLGLLYWLIMAAGRAPDVLLWDQASWHRWAANIAMPLAIVLGSLGVGAPNPFAFEGRVAGFDPDHPGIAGVTRQPLLWALGLWAGAHLLANGDLAHAVLFGTFAAFSFVGMGIVERRRRRQMGAAEWARLTAHTGLIPGAAWVRGGIRLGGYNPAGIAARLLVAAGVWAALWHLHAPVLGASPHP